MTDSKIILLYFSRSESAIEETDKKYGKNCRNLSYGILKNNEDSEECVNYSYLKVWNSIPPQRPLNFKAFLLKIVRNISFNMYEKNNAAKRGGGEIDLVLDELSEVIPANENVEKAIEDREITAFINYYLDSLSTEKRKIFMLRYFYIKPIKEIAETMGASEGKIKMILKRLKDDLREMLLKEGIEV